ncbi:MAG: dinitrogenase iron-molybdenum cofactor biosynthesis protein [Calditrichaeota bacterium]|nr:dinitrogenase iron-molybdenum cofactor biosynthesis protein [Calditrichota bacterium]
MKIAVTAMGTNLRAKVDPRFGRAQNFIIVDPETSEYEAISNEGVNAAHGAGTQSALLMSQNGVEAVITGNVGPNAHQTLAAAGIKMYQLSDATVEEAIEKFKNNELQEITQAGPAGH